MLKGKNVTLRSIERMDLRILLEWRNNSNLRRFFREYRVLSSENQHLWFEQRVVNDKNTIMFAIEDSGSQELIGACGLCYIDWLNRSADLSIYIGKEEVYIDHYYADDAVNLLIDYGFKELGLHRIWSEVYSFDDRKTELLARTGFSLEGCHRETHWTEGKWADSLYYSLLDKDVDLKS